MLGERMNIILFGSVARFLIFLHKFEIASILFQHLFVGFLWQRVGSPRVSLLLEPPVVMDLLPG